MKKLLLLFLFSGIAYAQPSIGTPNDLIACDDDSSGVTTFNLALNNAIILDGLDPSEYNVTYHETVEDAEFGVNSIPNTENYQNINLFTQTVYVRVTEIAIPANAATDSFMLTVNPAPEIAYVAAIVIFDTDGMDDGITTVDLTTTYGQILEPESPEGFMVSFFVTESDAVTDMNEIADPTAYTTQTATVYYRIENMETGCYSVSNFEVIVLPEDYETPQPEGPTTQTFSAGETLADLDVEGENIQWYATATGDTPLSMTTPLVNNTTYHAAQTVYNLESPERLPVTATMALGIEEQVFAALKIYPNPVRDVVKISNDTAIEKITITSLLGQTVLVKQINDNDQEINLSALKAGVYLMSVTAGNSHTSIKILKN